jgi:glycosyltransferase involved in cell wall biosynthesis
MNILYICDEYPPGRHGGIGTVVQLLARQLVKGGHKVVVAGFYDWGYGEEDYFTDEGVEVYRFRRKLDSSFFHQRYSLRARIATKLLDKARILEWDIKASLKKYKAFVDEIIEKHKIDIIERPDYNDYIKYCRSNVPVPLFNRPTTIKLHGSLTHIARGNNITLPQYIWDFEKDILEKADAVSAVSKYAADKAREYFNYSRHVEVLYNGINTAAKGTKAEKLSNTVVFTGALTENKGIYQLMKAWNIVNKSNPAARLLIFGKGPVEKVRSFLAPGAVETVIFHGHISREQLFRNLSTASCAIFPSYTENFALGPMEAMLSGTAIIYTQRTSGPELIDHNVDGLLIDPDNIEDIAAQITYLLQNPDICALFAAKALDKIHAKFDISVVAEKHIVYYNSILKSSN